MSYTVQQLAKIAGITVRALHHYDTIDLLKPEHVGSNGYRYYGEKELLKLQQIMFFREIELSLEEIRKVLDDPGFDLRQALKEHRNLVELKRQRMDTLLKTIDKTISKLTANKTMPDKDLYDGFSKEEAEAYAQEAKERWGSTEAYKQSQERYAKLSNEDKRHIQEAGDLLLKEIVASMDKGADSPEVQALIARHYDGLRAFYEPSLEIYRGLGSMYVDDPRFVAFFEKYHPDLPVFMRDAIHIYCDHNA
ncbi:MAG TPA: MerR family transcriptional regulator [Candidatus Paceibacterota bacterium]|nr:MerR family transcriptional regulator [Candidatus Paceibacterota bacterium]